MAHSLYDLCPCGSGKKIKFCCKDLAGEIEKIEHMLQAGQRKACLDHILRLEPKHPNHAYLQTRKAELQRELGQEEAAKATLGQLLEHDAQNPVVLAEAGLAAIDDGDLRGGLEWFHKALSAAVARGVIADRVLDALAALCSVATESNWYFVAEGHLRLYLKLVPDHEGATRVLASYQQSPYVPLAFKETLVLEESADPRNSPSAFIQGMDAFLGKYDWLAAERAFTLAAQQAPGFWQAWHNAAVLCCWLGENERAAEAWRQLAALDIPDDQAARAEAIAMSLLPAADTVEICQVEFPLQNWQQVQERLAQEDQLMPIPFEGEGWEGPPPKAVFMVLDRPRVRSAKDVNEGNLPRILASLMLFGRETDREARFLLRARRPRLEACYELVKRMGAADVGPPGEPQVLTKVLDEPMVNIDVQYPEDTTVDQRFDLRTSLRRKALMEVWPSLPRKLFDGLTPQQAAADNRLRRRLLGFLSKLAWELDQDSVSDLDVSALYTRLGLSAPQSIDLTNPPVEEGELPVLSGEDAAAELTTRRINALARIPVTDLARVHAEPLDDESLTALYQIGSIYRIARVVYNAAVEMTRRGNPAMRKLAFQSLPYFCEDTRKGLEHVAEARAALAGDSEVTVELEFAELQLCYSRLDARGVERCMQQIMDRHIRKPGVRDRLMQFMLRTGMIRPEQLAPGEEPPVEAAAAKPASSIWTPGSEPAPAVTPGTGSKLWVPE